VMIDGVAQPVRGRLSFGFEAHGVVVSQSILDHVEARLREALGSRRIEKVATIRQLDQKLNATRTVSPRFPLQAGGQKLTGSVTLDFLIDESGRVRMPVLDRADHRELAEAAVAALMEWQFDPPTQRGQPVIVKAKQQFLFKPEST
jgi:TonB family protein